jgi:tetratricopeptide (TPR) repeat protein
MAHDVFVSYSVKDKTTADAICASLEANGIRVWIAPRDVMPGSDWGESIIDAIHESKVMILVFSANSNASPQIKREIERAVNKGVTVVPFRIDDVMPSKTLEYFISTQHWLDAFTPPLEKHLDSLVGILQSLIAKKGEKVVEPHLKSQPPEEEEVPVRPAPRVAPADETTTITVRVPKWKILAVLAGLVIGATVAGVVVWWVVDKRPPSQTAGPKETGLPAEVAAAEYFQKAKNLQDPDEKVVLMNKAIQLNPKPGYYYIHRAMAYLKKKEYQKAVPDLDKAIASLTNSFIAYNLRGLAYDGLDKQSQAMADFNQAISINPGFAEAYCNRGYVFFENKEYGKALKDYDKAIALDPKLATAYSHRGSLFAFQGKLDKALEDYNKAISLDPKLLKAYLNRGNLYVRQKQYDLALTDFSNALPLDWRNAATYNGRGEAFLARNDFDSALQDFNQAIRLNPAYGKAYKNRGMVYMERRKFEEALDDFAKAISLNTDLAETYELRGKCHQKRGDAERARLDFEKAKTLQ